MNVVSPERTGWRDERISGWHRTWGYDCPAVDIDFLMLEYDTGEPLGFVEYKHENAMPAYPSHASYRAIKTICERANLVFFGCRYSNDGTRWNPTALNAKAKIYFPEPKIMSTKEWVTLLYKIRGRSLPDALEKSL